MTGTIMQQIMDSPGINGMVSQCFKFWMNSISIILIVSLLGINVNKAYFNFPTVSNIMYRKPNVFICLFYCKYFMSNYYTIKAMYVINVVVLWTTRFNIFLKTKKMETYN